MKTVTIASKVKRPALSAVSLVVLFLTFGAPAQASLAVNTSSIRFGNQAVGTTSAPRAVTITNRNRRSITLSKVSLSATVFSYTSPSLPMTLTPGQRLTISVSFSPTAAQVYSGSLVFTRSNGSMSSVSLSGTGVQAPTQAPTPTGTPTVTQAPAITSQPGSETVTAGQTASFSVAATGTAPLTYQWSKNGAAIAGAASSVYTTPTTTSVDSGAQFGVSVGNSAGSTASSAATLTVNAATSALNASSTALSFGNLTVSASGSQKVTLANAGTANITISSVSVLGPGFSASGVSTGLILSPGQTTTLTVMFSPSSTGSVTGSVTVASNASNSPGKISLSGAGLAQVSHSVALSWSPSTSVVVGYNSYSGTVSGGPYSKLNTTLVPAGTYTDATVHSGQTYYYVVTAVDANNIESPHSAESSAVIP